MTNRSDRGGSRAERAESAESAEPGRPGPGTYWSGGFRRRRRLLGISLLGLALLALAGTLVGARLLSGEEAAGGGSPDGQAGAGEAETTSTARAEQTGSSSASAAGTYSTKSGSKADTQGISGKQNAGNVKNMEKLGEFETDYRYSDSKARKYNLKLSSSAVDGTVISPGETFSMNDNIAGLDYKEAKVFADGGETSALGGGLCQVTSTVYMAAQYAGLDIVERNAHYTTLPYIRPGFDATVWFGGQGIPELDMKFKNTTGSDIRIREYVTDKGILKAEVWGQPTGKEVTMRSEQDFRDLDRGIKWSTYKTVKQDGEVVRQGLLHEDLYSFPPPTEGGSYNDVRTGGW
jgi:hypothetical protein